MPQKPGSFLLFGNQVHWMILPVILLPALAAPPST
jgi:hypothetical protein